MTYNVSSETLNPTVPYNTMFCRKAEGYPSGNYALESKLLVSKYIEADNHWQLLANCTEVHTFTSTFIFVL